MIYDEETDYIKSLENTYSYVSMLLEIIKKLRARIWEYKTKENAYTFLDIEKLAIKLVKEFEEVREETKHEQSIEIAKSLLEVGKMTYEEIARSVQLPVEEVKALDTKKPA